MDVQNIKRRVLELVGFVRSKIVVILLTCLILGIVFIEFQHYLDKWELFRQTQKIEEFDKTLEDSKAKTQALQTAFEQQHESTINILDAIKAMSGTITQLVVNDSKRDEERINLRNEYLDVRNQNTQNKKVIAARNIRRRLPVNQREQNALSADRELYPAAK